MRERNVDAPILVGARGSSIDFTPFLHNICNLQSNCETKDLLNPRGPALFRNHPAWPPARPPSLGWSNRKFAPPSPIGLTKCLQLLWRSLQPCRVLIR
ncbi:hypothetical protein Enr8_48280 [Blastopirellula retiformator]|uniref:Uncharacterized protein n=1 Tax=Blastopirellula retiformator TaxID=2527970 RepID=A0A5C5UVL0_9BACT|nr:hypothetical protein Enr8_48280 [Blastopirellula retiformator]